MSITSDVRIAPAPLRDYLVLLRPRGFGAASLFVLTGYALAPRAGVALAADLALLFVGYVLCISGGTLLYNSACDRDRGPVNFLAAPPRPPPHLHAVGLITMASGAVLLASCGPVAAAMAIAMCVLSVAYSGGFAFTRLKALPPFDLVVNALGYGAMSVTLGHAVTGGRFTAEVAWVALAFSLSMAASFPASQIFQLDPKKEERNSATWLGPGHALVLGVGLLAVAWLCLLFARAERTHGTASHAAFVVFTLLFAAAAVVLARWSRSPFEKSPQRLKLLLTLLLTARVVWIASALT